MIEPRRQEDALVYVVEEEHGVTQGFVVNKNALRSSELKNVATVIQNCIGCECKHGMRKDIKTKD